MTKNELKYYHKLKQKKFRDTENKFLIEGLHIVEECIRSPHYKNCLEKIFIQNDFNKKDLQKLKSIAEKKNIQIISIDEKLFKILSDTISPQGIIGVVSKPKGPFKKSISNKNVLSVALDTINDPGNLGTIIRTCYCFGVDELLIGNKSVDLFNPKVLRSTQGAIFNLNIKYDLNLKDELERYYLEDHKIILTDLGSLNYINERRFELNEKYIIVFGNETNGISKDILCHSEYEKMKIRIFTDCESLNISVSVAIVLNHIKNNII
ncbi:MAG: RNA methyltransferase [bacterium]